MPHEVRTDRDIATVLQKVATTAQYLTTAPHTGSHLRAAIEARIEDGLRAASYDGQPGGRGGSSVAERAALGGHRRGCPDPEGEGCTCPEALADRASEDLQRMLHGLEQWAEVEELLHFFMHRRYPIAPPPPPKTGDGPCPKGLCVDHWRAKIRRKVAQGRYATYCRPCGEHRAKHEVSIPEPVLVAAYQAGVKNGTKGDDWQHWTVKRAWSSCRTPEARPAQPSEQTTADQQRGA